MPAVICEWRRRKEKKLTTVVEPGKIEDKFYLAYMMKEVFVDHIPKRNPGRFPGLFSTFCDIGTVSAVL